MNPKKMFSFLLESEEIMNDFEYFNNHLGYRYKITDYSTIEY